MQVVHNGQVAAVPLLPPPGGAAGAMHAAPPAIPGWKRWAGLGTAALLTGGAIAGAVALPVLVGGAGMALVGKVVATEVLTVAAGVGSKVVKDAWGAKTAQHCQAGTLTGPQAQAAVGALHSPGPGLGTVAQHIVDSLPQGLSAQAAHAFLCGAHVVVPDNGVLAGLAGAGGLPPGVALRSSSHYRGAGQQYGCDIQIPIPGGSVSAHLLFGPTGNGDMFFQLEKHGTGGLANRIGHGMDYLAHITSGNAQVGPMGMVYASEKGQAELTVQQGQVMHRGAAL